jgi:hypothetical protein
MTKHEEDEVDGCDIILVVLNRDWRKQFSHVDQDISALPVPQTLPKKVDLRPWKINSCFRDHTFYGNHIIWARVIMIDANHISQRLA